MTTLRGGFTPQFLPAVEPVRSPREPRAAGEQVLLVVVDERSGQSQYAAGYRTTSSVVTDVAGQRVVRVARDADWRAWMLGPNTTDVGECPNSQSWPVELVWAQ